MYGFTEPTILESEVFATLPEEYRQEGRGPRSPMRKSKTGSTLEGPSFDRGGNLFFTDIPNSRVFRASAAGEIDLVASYEGEPNGLKIHRDGRIFIADHHLGILLLDPERGTVEPFVEGTEKERFKGVNDLVFSESGELFFTDQGATGLHDATGRVYRMDAEGVLHLIVDTVPSPNGLVLNETETILFVAATRSAAVWSVPFSAGGGIVKAGIFARLPTSGPDGMAMDVDGNLAVAHPGLGCVWLFDPRGLPIARVDSCAGHHLTNIAYGGEENRWLYMMEGDSFSILRAKMPAPGRRMFSHA